MQRNICDPLVLYFQIPIGWCSSLYSIVALIALSGAAQVCVIYVHVNCIHLQLLEIYITWVLCRLPTQPVGRLTMSIKPGTLAFTLG